MSTRTDITVDFRLSPRLITVAAPSDELSLQDLVDTLRDIEDNLPNGMGYPHLINAAGKEDLGGGVLVGITATLQNAQVSFESRTTELVSGTITTGGDNEVIDSGATFITDGIARGDLVSNGTDSNWASVLSVVSETELQVTFPTGGTTDDYTILDTYEIYDVVQCEISGGNLVSTDEAGGTISAVFETFGTQIVRTSSSSATTQNQSSLEFASFSGGVAIDMVNGTSGTSFPQGTREYPVDNFADLHTIATTRGLRKVFIMNNATISGVDFSVASHQFIGDSPHIVLTVDASADVSGCSMNLLTLVGELDGLNTIRDCTIGTVTNLSGFIEKCAFQSTATLNGTTFIAECYSQAPGSGYPTITSGANVLMLRDWHGSFGIAGMTAGTHTLEVYGGRLVAEATCSGGTIHLRGAISGPTEDFSGGGVTIIDQTESNRIGNTVWDEPVTDHLVTGTFGRQLGKNVLTLAKWLGLK